MVYTGTDRDRELQLGISRLGGTLLSHKRILRQRQKGVLIVLRHASQIFRLIGSLVRLMAYQA